MRDDAERDELLGNVVSKREETKARNITHSFMTTQRNIARPLYGALRDDAGRTPDPQTPKADRQSVFSSPYYVLDGPKLDVVNTSQSDTAIEGFVAIIGRTSKARLRRMPHRSTIVSVAFHFPLCLFNNYDWVCVNWIFGFVKRYNKNIFSHLAVSLWAIFSVLSLPTLNFIYYITRNELT